MEYFPPNKALIAIGLYGDLDVSNALESLSPFQAGVYSTAEFATMLAAQTAYNVELIETLSPSYSRARFNGQYPADALGADPAAIPPPPNGVMWTGFFRPIYDDGSVVVIGEIQYAYDATRLLTVGTVNIVYTYSPSALQYQCQVTTNIQGLATPPTECFFVPLEVAPVDLIANPHLQTFPHGGPPLPPSGTNWDSWYSLDYTGTDDGSGNRSWTMAKNEISTLRATMIGAITTRALVWLTAQVDGELVHAGPFYSTNTITV